MKVKKISLIMPVYNEERTLKQIINKILNVKWGFELELIIVNDSSKDSSLKIINSYTGDKRIMSITNDKNLGKSQTIKRGVLISTGDIVAIQDSDLEYEPEDLSKLINMMLEKSLDVAYGNRFGKSNKIIYHSNWVGNRALSFFSSLFTYPRARIWTNDMETFYKAVRGDVFRDIAKSINSTTNFGLEPEITAKLAKYVIKNEGNRHLKYSEMPINYYPRTVAEGKKMKGLSDGFKALVEIIRFNLF